MGLHWYIYAGAWRLAAVARDAGSETDLRIRGSATVVRGRTLDRAGSITILLTD